MSFHNNRPKTKTILPDHLKDRKHHVSQRGTYWKDVPKKVDWRDKHVVSKVKFQGGCGACWAFAVTQTIESMQVNIQIMILNKSNQNLF